MCRFTPRQRVSARRPAKGRPRTRGAPADQGAARGPEGRPRTRGPPVGGAGTMEQHPVVARGPVPVQWIRSRPAGRGASFGDARAAGWAIRRSRPGTQVLRLPGWNPVMMRRTVSLTFWPTGVEGMRLETVSSLSIYTFTMSARRLADALVRARPPRLRPPGAAPPAPAAAWNRTSAAENSSRSSAHRREKEARGSDPRLPRLTIEQGTWVHMWGATPCTPFGLPRLDYRPRGGYVMVVAARRWRQAARANSVQMHSVQMHSVSPARRSSSHVPQPLALWDVWSRTAAHFVHAGVMPARVRRYSFGRK